MMQVFFILKNKKEENKTLSDKELIESGAEDTWSEEEELNGLVKKRERFEKLMTKNDNPWGLSPKAMESKKAAMTMLSTKNGMFAKVPLICKGKVCPYSQTCELLKYDMAPVGEYCPTELAQIDIRAMGYSSDIDINTASFTDKNLLSELITLDIMLERCKALLAKEGTPVLDMAIGADREGNEIVQPTVSKAWDAYERMSKKRDSVYQLLMMTRKDKVKNKEEEQTVSLADMMKDIIDMEDIKE